MFNVSILTLTVFVILFAIFTFLGFYGSRWRKGDLNRLDEWGLAGRRLGTLIVWFLMGADLYTAYTFVAVPSTVLASGPYGFFAVPYVALTFGIALLTMPRLWVVSRNKNYVTASDFIKDRFNSRALSIAVAITGAVAELPYIALQIVGMQAVLAILLLGLNLGNSTLVSDLALLISFIVLAAFTFTSGLRGAALTGIFKDILIWITVLVPIIYVPLSTGGFSLAFQNSQTLSAQVNQVINGVNRSINYAQLNSLLFSAYISTAIGSALALYLYPHSINGSLSSQDEKRLKYATSFLSIYGVGLALLALFGILIYAVPDALNLVLQNPLHGLLTVPGLIAYTMPDWFVGIALLGIFVGGLVPAAIMAIAVANLLARNVIKEFKPNLSPSSEANLAKWISTIFKFIALAFVFIVPPTYAIQLQLLGGIIILQTLPSIFIGLYTNKMNSKALLAGWAVGLTSGIILALFANNFGPLRTSLFSTPLGPLYIGMIALGINLLVVLIGTLVSIALGWKPISKISEKDFSIVH
ncbi:MAG: sodium:solute symporter [Sulfolobaceae archaeon]